MIRLRAGLTCVALMAVVASAGVRAEEPAAKAPAAADSVEHTRVLNPNAFSLEAFGRGVIGSAQYDRTLSRDISVGAGFGMVGTSSGAIATLIPLFVNVYFARAQGSLYATAGVTFVPNSYQVGNTTTVTGNLQIAPFPMIANAGVGYENRSDTGFLIRIAAYGMYALNFIPWFGVTLGYSL